MGQVTGLFNDFSCLFFVILSTHNCLIWSIFFVGGGGEGRKEIDSPKVIEILNFIASIT